MNLISTIVLFFTVVLLACLGLDDGHAKISWLDEAQIDVMYSFC